MGLGGLRPVFRYRNCSPLLLIDGANAEGVRRRQVGTAGLLYLKFGVPARDPSSATPTLLSGVYTTRCPAQSLANMPLHRDYYRYSGF